MVLLSQSLPSANQFVDLLTKQLGRFGYSLSVTNWICTIYIHHLEEEYYVIGNCN